MARLLGVSLLVAGLGCALLVAPSESAADDGINCPSHVYCMYLFFHLLCRSFLEKLLRCCCCCAVSALLAFKKAIFEDPLAKLSDWNSKDENPCGWTGVGCSPFDSRVVTL